MCIFHIFADNAVYDGQGKAVLDEDHTVCGDHNCPGQRFHDQPCEVTTKISGQYTR